MLTRPRVVLLSAVLLTTLGGLDSAALVASPAHASPPLCDAMPATIVGNGYHYRLDGTKNDDVIVTNGASPVYAGDGNDTICVTGDDPTSVSGDAGDDTIDATAADQPVLAYTGAGDDIFTGGGENDTIDDTDGGTDRISTGGGSDQMSWNLDGNALPDTGADYVDLGIGNDRMDASSSSLGSTLIGGPGLNSFVGLNTAALAPADWAYDATRGELTRDGVDVDAFSGFTSYSFSFTGSSDAFVGTDAVDQVYATGSAPTTISLGGGNDILGGFLTRYTADGGAGHDLLQDAYGSRSTSTLLDLAGGTVRHTGPSLSVTGHVSGFEDATVAGPGAIRIVGDAQANRLSITDSCLTPTILGGPAADVLRVNASDPDEGLENCTGAKIVGGGGDDTMTGSRLGDTLSGGDGRDIARGGAGRDKCEAEVKSNCEY